METETVKFFDYLRSGCLEKNTRFGAERTLRAFLLHRAAERNRDKIGEITAVFRESQGRLLPPGQQTALITMVQLFSCVRAYLRRFAGTPPQTSFGPILVSLRTTAPAETMAPSPICTPDMITAVAPMVTLSPTRMRARAKCLPSMAWQNSTASWPMMQSAPSSVSGGFEGEHRRYRCFCPIGRPMQCTPSASVVLAENGCESGY